MWHAEQFLKESWCIDGECSYVGIKVIDGVNFAIYNLNDSKRGSFYVGISTKNKENQKELIINDLDSTKIPRDRFKSNYYKGEVREDKSENKIWTAKLYFKNHDDYNTFLNWWCGVEQSSPSVQPSEPIIEGSQQLKADCKHEKVTEPFYFNPEKPHVVCYDCGMEVPYKKED